MGTICYAMMCGLGEVSREHVRRHGAIRPVLILPNVSRPTLDGCFSTLVFDTKPKHRGST